MHDGGDDLLSVPPDVFCRPHFGARHNNSDTGRNATNAMSRTFATSRTARMFQMPAPITRHIRPRRMRGHMMAHLSHSLLHLLTHPPAQPAQQIDAYAQGTYPPE